jgi:multidrug resistance efflux pump
MGRSGKIFIWSMVGLLAVGGTGASFQWGPAWWRKLWVKASASEAPAPRAVETFAVRKGELRVVFVESGKLRAVKNHSIFPQISRQSLKISWIAAEGATVKKGDLVASFEKKTFEDQLQTKKAEHEAAKRQLQVAEAGLRIQQSTGKSNVSLAETKHREAQVALRTYIDLEAPKKLTDLESSLNDARTKLGEATKKVQEAQIRLDDEMFTEEDQRKNLENEVKNAKEIARTGQKTVDGLLMQRKIFRAYDYPQSLATKKAAVENAVLELAKAKVSAENENNQKEAEVAKQQDIIKRLNREIEQLNDNIGKCDLKAPVDGLVLYGDPNNPWRNYESMIKVGAEWYGGNVLLTIPDLSSFEIDIAIAEEYRGKVKEGLKTAVTLEAVPGLQLVGTLKEISKLGRPRTPWDPSGPRVFEAKISLDSSDPRMVSGMTTRAEIVAEVMNDVVYVPIDAVSNEDGKAYCLVRRGRGGGGGGGGNDVDKRLVKTGRSNENFVEIRDGLKEGELLSLVPVMDVADAK